MPTNRLRQLWMLLCALFTALAGWWWYGVSREGLRDGPAFQAMSASVAAVFMFLAASQRRSSE